MARSELKITVGPTPDDVEWDELLKFIHAAFAYMDARIDPPSSLHRMTAQILQEKASQETLVLAHIGNAMAGCMFCRVESDFLYVGKVAVALQFQGQGVGKQMFQTAFDLARTNGLQELELETRVELVENQRAFAKLGFVQTGTSAHEGYKRPTSIIMRALV